MSSTPTPNEPDSTPDPTIVPVGDFGITGLAERFYLDWAHDGTAMDEVVEFLADGRNVLAVRFDAQRLIASELTDDEVRSLWQTVAWHRPSPAEGGARAWLASIVGACDAWLAANGAPPVTKVDTSPADEALTRRVCDEAELLIGVEPSSSPDVSGWAATREQVVRSLQRCSRLVSPGLAFRILVRAVALHSLRITPEQYGRYRQIAAVLSYDEELVGDIAYLVT